MKVLNTIILWQDAGPCCEQTHAAFEVGLSLDHSQGVYSGWSDVVVSSQLRLCHTCIIDVMRWLPPIWSKHDTPVSPRDSLLYVRLCPVGNNKLNNGSWFPSGIPTFAEFIGLKQTKECICVFGIYICLAKHLFRWYFDTRSTTNVQI